MQDGRVCHYWMSLPHRLQQQVTDTDSDFDVDDDRTVRRANRREFESIPDSFAGRSSSLALVARSSSGSLASRVPGGLVQLEWKNDSRRRDLSAEISGALFLRGIVTKLSTVK